MEKEKSKTIESVKRVGYRRTLPTGMKKPCSVDNRKSPTPPATSFFLRTLEFQIARQGFLPAEIFSHQIGTHFHFVLAVPMIRGNNISREGTRQQRFAFGFLGGEACSDNHKGLSLFNRRQDISTGID
jgi:hypothetical protein